MDMTKLLETLIKEQIKTTKIIINLMRRIEELEKERDTKHEDPPGSY